MAPQSPRGVAHHTEGWTSDTQHQTSEVTFNLGGIPLEASRTCTTVTTWQSPGPIPFRARFVRKTWWRRLLERFRSPLRTDDAQFDQTVSVMTGDADHTLLFLEAPRVRESLAHMADHLSPSSVSTS